MGIAPAMRTAAINVVGIMIERHAGVAWGRVGDADAGRDTLDAGISPKVTVEAPVLLHNEHEVLDLLEAGRCDNLDSGARAGSQPDAENHSQQRQRKVEEQTLGRRHTRRLTPARLGSPARISLM